MSWVSFSHYWPFVCKGKPPVTCEFLPQRPSKAAISCCCYVNLCLVNWCHDLPILVASVEIEIPVLHDGIMEWKRFLHYDISRYQRSRTKSPQKYSNTEFWCFLCIQLKPAVEQTVSVALMGSRCNRMTDTNQYRFRKFWDLTISNSTYCARSV